MSIQDIKRDLEKIKGMIAEDNASEAAGLLSGIKMALTDVEGDISALKKTRHDANEESKERKTKIRELESQIEEKNKEIEELNKSKGATDEDYKALTSERDSLKSTVAEYRKGDRNKQKSWYEAHKDSANWDKMKDLFKLPEEVEGKLDWDNFSDDDLAANQVEISRAENYGIFQSKKSSSPSSPDGTIPSGDDGYFKDSDFG